MALLQTDHDNAAWLTGSPLSPARLAEQRFAHIREYVFAPIRRSLETLRQWSMRRQVRAWRTRTELARVAGGSDLALSFGFGFVLSFGFACEFAGALGLVLILKLNSSRQFGACPPDALHE